MAKTPVKKSSAKTAGAAKKRRSAGVDAVSIEAAPATGSLKARVATALAKGRGKGKAKTKTKARVGKNTSQSSDVRIAPDSAIDASVLDRLFDVVTSRRDTDPAISHSARLLSRGTRKIAQKFGEEAVECLIEAVAGRSHEMIGESADVLYHLIVMWVDAGVTPAEVWAELARREGTSGIEEKASRVPVKS